MKSLQTNLRDLVQKVQNIMLVMEYMVMEVMQPQEIFMAQNQ